MTRGDVASSGKADRAGRWKDRDPAQHRDGLQRLVALTIGGGSQVVVVGFIARRI